MLGVDIIETYKRVRDASEFTSNPWERLEELGESMFVDPTLPNVALGIPLTAAAQAGVGMVDLRFVAVAVCVWVLATMVYVVGDEAVYVSKALSEAKEQKRREEEYVPGIE